MNTITIKPYNFEMIDRADLSEATKYQYKKALSNYLDAGHEIKDYQALSNYAANLNNSSRSFLKAAVKMYFKSILNEAKAQATPDNVLSVTATQYRIDALNEAITVSRTKGQKVHAWLTTLEAENLMGIVKGDDIVSQRDRLVLALLLHAGLRRNELVSLKFEDVVRIDDSVVLNVLGKGRKYRAVPIRDEVARMIEDWGNIVANKGYIIRSLGMNREPKDSISGQAIMDIVTKYGKMIGKPNLQPHDLRRTFAEVGRRNGISLEELSVLLGHNSIATTQIYFNLKVNLTSSPSKFMPI